MCESMEKWRSYFKKAEGNIFEVIKHAISVAVADHPKEFKLERDEIAERLFSCLVSGSRSEGKSCCGERQRVELSVVPVGKGGGLGGEERGKSSFVESGVDEGKVITTTSSIDDNLIGNQVSRYSYDEAEALTEEMEEESEMLGEVLRIKEMLLNHEDESPKELYDSLRKLQLMGITVDCLQATEIGKAVKNLMKHRSAKIRSLSKKLLLDWRRMVDELMEAAKALKDAATDGSPDSVNPIVINEEEEEEEEEGLPAPPFDEAFFATQPTTMELSKFFDEMDEDGNLQNKDEFVKSRESGTRRISQNPYRRPVDPVQKTNLSKIENDSHIAPKQETLFKQTKPGNVESAAGRSALCFVQYNASPETPPLEAKRDTHTQISRKTDSTVRRPAYSSLDLANSSPETPLQPKQETGGSRRPVNDFNNLNYPKPKPSDEVSTQLKLEAAKRKLHEGYQQAENAKKQRTIQVMDIRDMPKNVQSLGPKSGNKSSSNRNSHAKSGLHSRTFGRR